MKPWIALQWHERIGPIVSVTLLDRTLNFCLCHRLPDRTIPFFGLEKYLCSRCLGILIGTLFGLLLQIANYHISFPVGILLMLPMILDGTTQALKIRQSNNALRFFSGLLFGIGINGIMGLTHAYF